MASSYVPSVTPGMLPGGLNPANFSGVGGNTASQAIVSTLFTYNPFAIYQDVVRRHSQWPAFRQMLRMQNAARRVNAPTTGHYEADWQNNLLPLGTVQTPSGGAGNSAIYNLAAGAMFDAGATIGGSARQASFVRVGDILQAFDGVRARVEAKNTTVTPHRITIKPLDSTQDVATSFLASTTYAIFDNMWSEGSALPEAVIPRLLKYTNQFQIVKGSASSTGTELTNTLYARYIPGQDGNIFLAMKADEMYRYERAVCYTLLFGTQADNLTQTGLITTQFDVPILGTEGLIPFVENNGHTDTYTAGAYSIDDFDALAVIYTQERIGTRQIITYDGFTIFQETENALQNLLNANLTVELMKQLSGDGGVPMDDFQPFDNADFSFYIGFRALKKSGFTFYFRQLHEFSEYLGAGAPNYPYPGYRVTTPLGFTTNQGNQTQVPYVAYEYKSDMKGYDRHDLADTYGGVGTPVKASNAYDWIEMGILSEIAGHFACPNQCVIQKAA